jgi:hypothetical protein
MNLRLLVAGAFVLLTGCGAPIPEGEIDTYCPECYERIQNGQAFVPPAAPAPVQTEGGAARG